MRYINNFDSIEDSIDEPLVIHRHSSSIGRALVVLLHGLGGTRYGTWTPRGQRPTHAGLAKFLYEDFTDIDVGLYRYRTGKERLKFWKSIPLKREARVLTDRLRDQSKVYKVLILVGHSMGGILAKAAVCELIQRDDKATLGAIRALMLLATPQAGSLCVPKFLWRFTKDGHVLRTHSDLLFEIQTTFTNRILADPNPSKPKHFVIPTYVVAAAEDNWVDEFSAGLNVDHERTYNVRGSHMSAVKPKTKDEDGYQWLRDKIRERLESSDSREGSDQPNDSPTLHPECKSIFRGALPDIWNVPHLRNPNFTEPDNRMTELHDALHSGRPAALAQALAGLGGMGKTQLVVEYAYRYAIDYGIVWWLRSEQSATLAADYSALAQKLDLPEKDATELPRVIAAVRGALQHRNDWLLIFDNAEKPQDLKEYLPSVGGHVIITSRYQAWGKIAQRVEVGKWPHKIAIEFLAKRTGQNENAAAAVIARELDCLPLALEQAPLMSRKPAAHSPHMSRS